MFKNYITTAIRNFVKHKGFSLINILGLAISISVFSIIFQYIKTEISYDQHHKNGDQIYRLVEIQMHSGYGTNHISWTMGPLAAALKSDFPEVIYATRLSNGQSHYCQIGEKEFFEEYICYADPDLLRMFTIPMVTGNPESALNEPNSVILQEHIAKKYFGDEDPMGKSIKINNEMFHITGVMEDEQHRSHMKFNMLLSYSSIKPEELSSWFRNTLSTYVMVEKGTSKQDLDSKLPGLLMKYRKIENDWEENLQMYFQPMKKIHLYSQHFLFDCHHYHHGSITNVKIFSAIALLIIIIACINFVNLSTAKATQRTKEICVRKVCGSNRGQLIRQFWIEAIFLSTISFIVTLVLIQFWIPVSNALLNETLSFSITDYSILFILNTVIGIIAGWYPSLYLSKFHPIHILKKTKMSGAQKINLRKALVLAQFVISIILIVSTIVIYNQRQFIRFKDLGYNIENVVYLELGGEPGQSKIDVLKTEFTKNGNIIDAAATSKPNGGGLGQSTFELKDNPDTECMMELGAIDCDYIETMQMQMKQGRNFSKEITTDRTSAVIINETAVQKLGLDDPLGIQFENEFWGIKQPLVVGVVQDFHFYSLRDEIKPCIFTMAAQHLNFLVVRIKQDDIRGTIHYMKDTWQKLVPSRPFKLTFLDKRLDQQYQSEENMNRLFLYFSSLAIFISCLGLLGLSAYAAEQRTKEIGIRKVLGATSTGLVTLLSKDFTKYVLLANLIAWPIAYYMMNKWLQNFAYHIRINWSIFFIAGGVAFGIALVTVSFQAVKAAMLNPVDSLKYE